MMIKVWNERYQNIHFVMGAILERVFQYDISGRPTSDTRLNISLFWISLWMFFDFSVNILDVFVKIIGFLHEIFYGSVSVRYIREATRLNISLFQREARSIPLSSTNGLVIEVFLIFSQECTFSMQLGFQTFITFNAFWDCIFSKWIHRMRAMWSESTTCSFGAAWIPS